MTEMHLRICAIMAVLLLVGTRSLGQTGSGSPYVHLADLESERPLRFGTQKQLLVDNEVLCAWYNVKRVQGVLQKHPGNPLLEADAAWEETARKSYGIQLGTAIYDAQDKKFKIWYQIEQHTGGSVVAYAESQDGVKWVKPNLGLVRYQGTMQNNVLLHSDHLGKRPLAGSIRLIQDPRERSAERKFLSCSISPYHEDGSRFGGWNGMAYSGDGLTWHQMPGGLRGGGGGGNPSIVWDESLGKYVLFHRQLTEKADPETGTGPRYIVRQESEDLVAWSPRQTVFHPMSERWPEVESMKVYRYQGVYLGLPSMLDNYVRGDVEQHLIISRDGFRWDYPFPDQAFIPQGAEGRWDDNIIWWPSMIPHGEKLMFYYAGARYHHGIKDNPPEKRQIRIGLGWVPLDRLMGLQSRERLNGKGALLTRPFVVEGDELFINAEVQGELRAEIVDTTARQFDTGTKVHMGHYISSAERKFDGFRREDCEVVRGDSLAHRVRWKGQSLAQFRGKAIRLRLVFKDATIWAFQVADTRLGPGAERVSHRPEAPP